MVISCLLWMAPPATAGADEPKSPGSWSDEAEFSYVETSGNSAVKTISVRNLLSWQISNAWSTSLKIAALRGETNGTETAARYLTELRTDDNLSERTYLFVSAGWQRDEFAGIEANTYAGPGIGYRWLAGPRHKLLSEIGAHYVNERTVIGTENRHIDGRLFIGYTLPFDRKNKFAQTIEYLHDFHDSDNYRFNTETAFVMALNSILSLKLSYVIRYDHQPVPDTLERSDSTLSAALLATF